MVGFLIGYWFPILFHKIRQVHIKSWPSVAQLRSKWHLKFQKSLENGNVESEENRELNRTYNFKYGSASWMMSCFGVLPEFLFAGMIPLDSGMTRLSRRHLTDNKNTLLSKMNSTTKRWIGFEGGINQQDKTSRVVSNASHYIKSTGCSRHNNILLNGHTNFISSSKHTSFIQRLNPVVEQTSQLKSAAAAKCSLSWWWPPILASVAKLSKKLIVSERPWWYPWRISKPSTNLLIIQIRGESRQVPSERFQVHKETHLEGFCVWSTEGIPASFPATWYHSGTDRSLPGALCSWKPSIIASRSLLAPLSYIINQCFHTIGLAF